MKYFVRFFVVTLFLLVSTYASAEQKIAYIDMKYILNNSDAGKKAQDELKKKLENGIKSINSKQKKLQEEEKKFLDGITKKYGEGSLNPETGVFTPNK